MGDLTGSLPLTPLTPSWREVQRQGTSQMGDELAAPYRLSDNREPISGLVTRKRLRWNVDDRVVKSQGE